MIEDHFDKTFSVLVPTVVGGLKTTTFSATASDIRCCVQPISYGRTFFHSQRAVNYNYSVLCTTDVVIPDDAKIVIDGIEHWYLGGKRQSYPFFTFQLFIGEFLE
jgi:hypothetical protein